MDNNYTWVKTHKGIVEYLRGKEDSQQELIDLLKQLGITGFNDRSKDEEHDIELREIDPFTFFCFIHKHGDKRRLKYLQQIAKKLDVEAPLDVKGIPTQAQKVWLFPFMYLRVNNEISRLWSFFKKVLNGEITDEDFADVLQIRNVGKTKLTEALFYINPEKYLPINGPTKPYIKDVLGLDYHFSTYSEYVELLGKIREKIDMPFYELSHEAWVWNIDKTKENYWVFQGNPDKYDFETAFKEDDIDAWTVTSHKASIKEGDKVIIWITGSKAGCYALADVVSEPMDRESFADSDLWKEEDTSELKAAINITHNLANNPILKDEIDKIKDLDNLKVGSQGTNFSATKQEYETLLELAVKRNEEKRYWLYSPGEQAKDWEEFYNDGIMGLGWDKLDDLKSYKSKDEIKKALDEAYGGDGSKKNDTTANDEFANVMKVGDVVIVKKGLTELLGYGVVVSDYIYDEDRDNYKHIRKMDWKLDGSWHIEEQMPPKTLTDITYSSNKDPNYDTYYESLLGIMDGDENGGDDSQFLEIKNKFDLEYGYELFENFIKNLRKIVSELNLKPNDERVVYTVRYNRFNFIIGQRYCFNIHLKHPNGVYGFISSEKLDDNSNPFKGKPEAYYNHIDDFNLTAEEWSSLIDTMRRELEKVAKAGFLKHNNADFENYVFQGIANGEPMIPSNTILYGPPGTGKTYNTINEALKIIDNKFFEENIDNRQALNKRFRELRFNPSTGEGQIAFITFHQSLSYEDFIEGIKPVKYEGEENVRYEVCSGLFKSIANNANNDRIEHEEDNANKPYVIIIDEINRGNISQIFGELITLIEPDKRKGQAEEIEVILPYSKERFSVPSNLHIIGTMNTADRSVEALDTALRRRFSFVEMNPVPGLLSKDEFGCKGVDLEAMLRAINGRIEKLLDRDYCIGHSYFMTIKDKQEPLEELKYIFQNKILPLLQEYFYGDWGKIRLIVGKEFVDRRKSDVDFLDEEGEEDIEEFEDRTIYSFTDCEGWTLDSFKSIYEEK